MAKTQDTWADVVASLCSSRRRDCAWAGTSDSVALDWSFVFSRLRVSGNVSSDSSPRAALPGNQHLQSLGAPTQPHSQGSRRDDFLRAWTAPIRCSFRAPGHRARGSRRARVGAASVTSQEDPTTAGRGPGRGRGARRARRYFQPCRRLRSHFAGSLPRELARFAGAAGKREGKAAAGGWGPPGPETEEERATVPSPLLRAHSALPTPLAHRPHPAPLGSTRAKLGRGPSLPLGHLGEKDSAPGTAPGLRRPWHRERWLRQASACASVIVRRCVRACVRECGTPSLGRLCRVGSERNRFTAGPSRALAVDATPAAGFLFCTPPLARRRPADRWARSRFSAVLTTGSVAPLSLPWLRAAAALTFTVQLVSRPKP
nr:uncharacterized protein LOC111752337 [Loxodonta africana]